MKKVKLELDALAVESFAIAAAGTDEGTVRAYDAPTPPYYTCGCTTGASYLERYCPPPTPVVSPGA